MIFKFFELLSLIAFLRLSISKTSLFFSISNFVWFCWVSFFSMFRFCLSFAKSFSRDVFFLSISFILLFEFSNSVVKLSDLFFNFWFSISFWFNEFLSSTFSSQTFLMDEFKSSISASLSLIFWISFSFSLLKMSFWESADSNDWTKSFLSFSSLIVSSLSCKTIPDKLSFSAFKLFLSFTNVCNISSSLLFDFFSPSNFDFKFSNCSSKRLILNRKLSFSWFEFLAFSFGLDSTLLVVFWPIFETKDLEVPTWTDFCSFFSLNNSKLNSLILSFAFANSSSEASLFLIKFASVSRFKSILILSFAFWFSSTWFFSFSCFDVFESSVFFNWASTSLFLSSSICGSNASDLMRSLFHSSAFFFDWFFSELNRLFKLSNSKWYAWMFLLSSKISVSLFNKTFSIDCVFSFITILFVGFS